LKKGGWITHLSTRILKPSQQKYFEEKFTASVEDILVSPSVVRGSEKEKKTQGTYGHTSESMSGQLDLFGASLKMSEATPRWGYGESCPIWKKMVTERNSDCSQRRKQARLTNASECSSWQNYPTPEAHTVEKYSLQKDGQKKTQRSRNLTAMAINGELDNWATPNTMDYMETRSAEGVEKIASGARKGRKRPSNLREQVDKKTCDIYAKHNGPPAPEKSSTSGKNHGSWPTARSSDAEGGRIKTERTEKGFRSKREKSDQYFGAKLRDAAEMEKPPTMKLNPNWCEQLMGLPIGWTDLGSWATESSHKPQN